MKIGFLAHPTTVNEKNYVRIVDIVNKLIAEGEHGYRKSDWRCRDEVPFARAATLRSITGAECEAILHEFPQTAEDMLSNLDIAQDRVVRAVESLACLGADLVGLGGTTSIIGGRGTLTAQRVSVPVTSGNSLTAYAAHAALMHLFETLAVDPTQTRVTVVGYPGSISLAITRLLLEQGVPLNLVHSGRASEATLRRHLGQDVGKVRFVDELQSCFRDSRIFVSATSAGGVIEESALPPGACVIDVGLPRDVRRSAMRRTDVLIIDSGYLNAGPDVILGASIASISINRHINACLAETIVLGLEGRAETYSLGRNLDLDRVKEIGRLAAQHGFEPLPLASWREPLDDDRIRRLCKFWEASSAARRCIDDWTTKDRYRRTADRLLVNHVEFNHIDFIASGAQGSYILIDEVPHLDLDACRGQAILGHNHPQLVSALCHFLGSTSASAVNHVTMPRESALLCERLAGMIPGRPRSITVTTSGVEAVQCALRTAMAATGRPGVVRVDCFPLVVGRWEPSVAMRTPPGFLPPDPSVIAECVDDGVGAVVVEPLWSDAGSGNSQQVGAVLGEIEAMAKSRGAVFVVDETATAFRTNRFLASTDLGLDPDIVCLGEALSGAVVPVGAACIAQETWEQASRNYPGSPVALSPMGASNIVAVAANALLDIVTDETVWTAVSQHGRQLGTGLLEMVERWGLPTVAGGAGLFWNLRCDDSLSGGMQGLLDDFTARSPGYLARMIRELPVIARDRTASFAEGFEDALEQFFFDRVITKLANDHRVLADASRRAPRTLVISPPLLIDETEVSTVLDALNTVFSDMSSFEAISSN